MEILGYISLFLVGVVLGALGSGGSILSVPVLVYLFSIQPLQATAYSLFVVGATSSVGVILKFRERRVDPRAMLLFGGPSLVSIFFTRSYLLQAIPAEISLAPGAVIPKDSLLLLLFAVLTIVAALVTLRGQKHRQAEGSKHSPAVALVLAGAFSGCLSGMAGIGGGFIVIAALFYFSALSFEAVIGTSLFIVAGNSLVGFAGDCVHGPLDWPFLASITALAILGIAVGTMFGARLGSLAGKVFGWFVLIVGCGVFAAELLKQGFIAGW